MSRDRNLLLKFMCVHPRVCVFILPFLVFSPCLFYAGLLGFCPFFLEREKKTVIGGDMERI